jgi:hypothetical protein
MATNELVSADYGEAHRVCDVVMKGGITSGVVYPLAVCELARDYRFKCVGGTSAGAIAAAATAAAEYGRQGGKGFGRLAGLPDELGKDGKLLKLFQPQGSTRRLFDVLIGGLQGGAVGASGAALRGNALTALAGAAPGGALTVLSALHWIDSGFDGLALLGCLIGGLAAALGATLAVTLRLAHTLLRQVPDNGFGICSGVEVGTSGEEALTPWLARLLDDCAGIEYGTDPLTFGHLWAGPDGDRKTPPAEGQRFVELQMMTTNLINRTGKTIPWERGGYYYDPMRFRELFPGHVVDWMESRAPELPDTNKGRRSQLHRAMMLPYLPLPEPQDLPVVVAARMSLSFPVLLSAVPLWCFDYTRPASAERQEAWDVWLKSREEEDPDWKVPAGEPKTWGRKDLPTSLEPEVCWFSDGGITSNFPIHFFDRLVPGRPTFGIDLRPFPLEKGPDPDDQSQNVKIAKDNGDEIKLWWYRLPDRPAAWFRDRRLSKFLGAAVKTMQNRIDEAQMRAPGFRDRIAHVEMDSDEGGMNLDMGEPKIKVLSERGRLAAADLSQAFQADPGSQVITWDNHRWIRLRSAFAALEQMHVEFAQGFAGDGPGEEETGWRSYQELLDRGEDDPPASYRITTAEERGRAGKDVAGIADLATGDDAEAMVPGAPKPTTVGRIVPKE